MLQRPFCLAVLTALAATSLVLVAACDRKSEDPEERDERPTLRTDLTQLCDLMASDPPESLAPAEQSEWFGEQLAALDLTRDGDELVEVFASGQIATDDQCIILNHVANEGDIPLEEVCATFCPLLTTYGEDILAQMSLPQSTSVRQPAEGAISVLVDEDVIRVEDRVVERLRPGREVIADDLDNDLVIRTLAAALREGLGEGGSVHVFADAHTPFRLLNQVIESAYAAGSQELSLVVSTSPRLADSGSSLWAYGVQDLAVVPLTRPSVGDAPGVRLFVDEAGFRCNARALPVAYPGRYGGSYGFSGERFDWVGLYACLDDLAEEVRGGDGSGAADQMTVCVADRIEWDLLVRIIDTARHRRAANASPGGSVEVFLESEARVGDDGQPVGLFPRVALTAVGSGVCATPAPTSIFGDRPVGTVQPPGFDQRLDNMRRRPGPDVEVALGQPTVDGHLDRETIQRVIRQHRREVRDCYQRELQRTPDLAGRVVVNFTIDPEGNVAHGEITESEMGSELVEECIVRRIRRWRFPAPSTPGLVRVTYPFVFTSE